MGDITQRLLSLTDLISRGWYNNITFGLKIKQSYAFAFRKINEIAAMNVYPQPPVPANHRQNRKAGRNDLQ